ncbi:hypothetical protein [Sandaracinus amylolyticus]|uniref:Uncharacterized protein n=1 Tax=Sandaracinus amylolyticus TaxID=927083 RepID=A0A0F6SDT9_9BACT|nr:hypothetical protein [Sandaracinus amylolyticus]AKF04024.1 hypothetical protein DB32_001173 [Sandaracinus amylolyticus]
MHVFRDGKREIDVHARLRALAASRDPIDTLLRAGELECALLDAGDPAARDAIAWTDAAADAVIAGTRVVAPPLPSPRVDRARASVPEGFAYYAIHPLEYAHAATRAVPPGVPALVLGIRTIGTTLSAIAAAALRARGSRVIRATVRPTGHPFDRRATLDPDVAAHAASTGVALVIDEGPGLSGSSFLAAADALVAAGAPRDRVILVASHAPDVDRLCAPSAAARWRALRVVVASPTRVTPEGARDEISAGAWRASMLDPSAPWPPSWPAMERRKHLARDGSVLKYEGLACFGDDACARGEALASLGISPRLQRLPDGFVRWERAPGRPLSARDDPPLDAIARAIAARLEVAPAALDHVSALERATADNLRALLHLDRTIALPLARPVIADGHLAPHEWIVAPDGSLQKVDAIAHGDDHFFPGPCDVAWDLAGAIVEWDLDDAHTTALLDRYVRATGDHDARARVPSWTIAYLAFRAAWLAMARDACGGDERARLASASDALRARLTRML